MTEKILSILAALLLLPFTLLGQPLHQSISAADAIRLDSRKAMSNNCIFDADKLAKIKAPKGYKPFYISHFGRHGSRYAFTDIYHYVDTLLAMAEKEGQLTEYGKMLYAKTQELEKKYSPHVGELSQKGWDQHYEIAKATVRTYPEVFSKGAGVRAVSSDENRAMMSMTAFISGLKEASPSLPVYATARECDQHECRPGKSKSIKLPIPYNKDAYREGAADWDLLKKIFKNPNVLEGHISYYKAAYNLYVLYCGLSSLSDCEISFDGLFTDEDMLNIWEIANVSFWERSYRRQRDVFSMMNAMVEDCDDAFAKGRTGGKFRFTHDTYMMPMMILLSVNDNGMTPGDLSEVKEHFRSYEVPMAATLHFVFYRNKKSDDILCGILLNGEQATVPISTKDCGLYSWDDLKAYIQSRCR